MPEWLKFPLVLLVVTLISAAALASLNRATLPAKQRIQNEITEQALKVVMPQATQFEEVDATVDEEPFSYRLAKNESGKLVGYVSEGSADGYSSRLKVMVGVLPEFEIKGIKILFQKETPGLGDKVNEVLSKKTWWTVITDTSPDESSLRPWFQVQFDGTKSPVKLAKKGGTIEAITGATISSEAVCKAVNSAVEKLQKAIKKEK
jgi:RnfABCDGE-type electron transport complex G subunit